MKHLYSGKVRDIWVVDDERLLFVASDRMSAFDVVMAEPIPDKGRVLTATTAFWCDRLADLAPTHLVSIVTAAEAAALSAELEAPSGGLGVPPAASLAGRAMIVRRAEMLPIECIVRGYLSGSAWKEYREHTTVHGYELPPGLRESEQLPEPLFTPSTKAATGHDENISFSAAVDLVGKEVASQARELALAAYGRGAAWAGARGIIIADTKFEFGFIDGALCICDEILTPDSSRFWPADRWEAGSVPPSYDKQPVRDWLESTGWDKAPPPPHLPADVVASSQARYVEAYERITGLRLDDWPGAGAGGSGVGVSGVGGAGVGA